MQKVILKKDKTKIQKRSDLFDLLQTYHENPDYSCIEVYWEVLKPRWSRNLKEITVTDKAISLALAPHDKDKSYYSYPTIRRKLNKLEDCKLIEINKIYRYSGCEYMTPIYEFYIKVL